MATARAGERKLDLLKNIGDIRSSRSPLKRSEGINEGDNEGVNLISSDLLTPVRFNILGQMQIQGKTHSSSALPLSSATQGLLINQINSAFSLHQSHSGLGHGPTPSHLRNRNSHTISNNTNNSHAHSRHSNSNPEPESPLDFSTKKIKLEEVKRESSESPSSRLRNILSMKSPSITEDMGAGVALNLSKESPSSTSSMCSKSGESRGSLTSSPLSPSMEHPQTFIPSPRPATIPVSVSASGPIMFSAGNGATPYPLSFSPWGNGAFSPSLSPVINQSSGPTGAGSIALETSAAMFPHQITIATVANTSPGGINFSAANQMHIPCNGVAPTNKTRPTRPFKAYPKDPMTFSSVGLYGLPMGPAPGGTEALLHQQSNQAYAEFRKQMLASSQLGRTRRVGQKSGGHGESDSSNENDGINFEMSMENDSVMAADSSPENDLCNEKSRLGKSEQQMKDEAYWERRRKNNEAAKRSRDARRAKEDEIAIRAAFLEQENLKLRFELCALKNETAKLRCMLYTT